MALKELTVKAATAGINISLKERTFNDNFKNVMLYINKINIKDNTLRDIFIQDQRTTNAIITITAPYGVMALDSKNAIFHLRLNNGNINQVDLEKRTVNNIKFKEYTLNLDIQQAVYKGRANRRDEKDMRFKELLEVVNKQGPQDEDYYEALLEVHRKFAIPTACFVLGLLAMPLGVQVRGVRKSFGFGLGISCFLLYYMLLSVGLVFGVTGDYPPCIGMWLPNIFMGILGIYFFRRTIEERPFNFRTPGYFVQKLKTKILETSHADHP